MSDIKKNSLSWTRALDKFLRALISAMLLVSDAHDARAQPSQWGR
ncbi:hypothetical protein [Bradyrhizobium sp. S3.2.12]